TWDAWASSRFWSGRSANARTGSGPPQYRLECRLWRVPRRWHHDRGDRRAVRAWRRAGPTSPALRIAFRAIEVAALGRSPAAFVIALAVAAAGAAGPAFGAGPGVVVRQVYAAGGARAAYRN